MTSVTPYAEVIGDPVAHSMSPLIHNRWLAELGLIATYRATRVTCDDLAAYLVQRRADPAWRGCNVTMPHKQSVIPLLDTVDAPAKAIGAVNTIWRGADGRLHGRNTDLHGIRCSLADVALEGARVILVGAGGAARSAAFALGQAKVARLFIMSRDPVRARNLGEELFSDAEIVDFDHSPAADLLINATPLGMEGKPWPRLPLDGLAPGATLFDMVYAPARTELLAVGQARGLRTVGGAVMLIHQAAEAFATFFGQQPPLGDGIELQEQLTA